jgi:thioredoxin 1
MTSKTKTILGILAVTAFLALAVNVLFFDKGPSPAGFKTSANVVEVTDKTFQQEVLDSKIPVVIDFNATWCGPCKTYSPIFHKVADQYAGKVKFVSIDVDKSPAVAALFGINAIPATVFLSETNGVISAGAASGALDEATLKKLLDYCLTPGAKLIPLFERKKPTDPNATPVDPNAAPADPNVTPADPNVAPKVAPSVKPKADDPTPIIPKDETAPKVDPNPSVDPLPRVDPLPKNDGAPKAEEIVPAH